MSWWDTVESGDPDEAALLLSGLQQHPDSMWRAAQLRDDPPMELGPDDEPPDRVLDWYGLNPVVLMLTRIYNLLAGPRAAYSIHTTPWATEELDDNQIAINTMLRGG